MAEAQYFKCESESSKRLLERYIAYAESAIENCRALSHINGAQKLERKCHSELKYLHSLSKRRGGFDDSNVRSSNLGHYLGVIHSADSLPDVSHILQAFSCPGRREPLYADIVAGEGRIWVKVIARKAQALHLVWAGNGQYGDRDILIQAEEYVTCAKEHPVNFVEPKVVFAFYNGVTADMAAAIRDAGVQVSGNIVGVSEEIESMLRQLDLSNTDSDMSDENDDDMSFTHDGEIPIDSELAFDVDEESEDMSKDLAEPQNTDGLNDKAFCDTCGVNNTSTVHSSGLQSDSSLPMRQRNLQTIGTKTILQQTNTVLDDDDSMEHTDEVTTDTATFTEGFQVSQTAGQTNIPRLKINHQQSSSQSPVLNKVYVPGKRSFQTEIDVVSSALSDGGNKYNQSIHDPSDENVPYTLDGELLMRPFICFTKIKSLLGELKDHTLDSIGKLNLDVSAMINLVSAVTHGRCRFRFKEPVLSEQAADERSEESLPKIEPFLKGKELYACETAVDSFKSIVDLLGGKGEVVRAQYLLKHVTVVADSPSFRTQCLPTTGKIKDRAKVIFGTGDSLKAVTLTANSAFIRAARNQGCLYSAHVIPARALTEKKEGTGEFLAEFDHVTYHRECGFFASVCPDVQRS